MVIASVDSDFCGVWLSLAERLVWDQEVAGSNPVTPIPNGDDAHINEVHVQM